MLPVLLHRIANTTQLLTGLHALLAVDPVALEARAGDLACAGERVDETGWLLALLASAAGARLLLDRRERAGLRPLVDCVRDCLRRQERDLADADDRLPDLSPRVGDGWQLPWAIGSFLYAAAQSSPVRGTLEWKLESGAEGYRFSCRAPASSELAHLETWLSRELPLAGIHRQGEAVSLELPRSWLREPGAPA